MVGRIFEIKRFAVHDGDGIRTTVFLKGCPLRCKWCHNPESFTSARQLALYEHKCIGCGECVEICPNGAHRIENGVHTLNRSLCVGCGKCADSCLGAALTLYGRDMTVEEVVEAVMEDEEFYRSSGGGVTLSGGECLLQADFCREVLKELKARGINTAVDTCGDVPREALDKVIPYVDRFLYDVKAIDPELHRQCTGRDNSRILDNLLYLDSRGCEIEVRVPLVPDNNDSEAEAIGKLLEGLKGLVKVRVLPYHGYAGSKYTALGMEYPMTCEAPTEEQLRAAEDAIIPKRLRQ